MNKVRKNSSKANSLAAKPQKENFWVYYLIIFLTAFLLYSNTIPNTFSFDDDYVTYHNAQIKNGFKGIPEILTTRYSLKENHTFGYRPVAKVTFAIEYQLFGENPHVSHFLNIIFYAITGISLFILLKKMFSKYNSFVLLVCTLLFLAHPIHTEVVASLKNREDIFSFLFSILSLITLINYIRKKELISLIISIFLFILAILSKLNAAIFVLIIPLALYYAFDDIKIHFPIKSFITALRLKQEKKEIIIKVESYKKLTKQKNYIIGDVILKRVNVLWNSIITKIILFIHFVKRFSLFLFHFFIEHIFFICGLATFILISYFTKVTLPWLISSLVGIHFMTREGKYSIRDIIKSKYFSGILFLLSFIFFVNLNVFMVLSAKYKIFIILPAVIMILLIIKILLNKDKKENNLLIDFFSNKYLILFHFVYLILGLVSLIIFQQFNLNAISSILVVMLILTSIMIVYSLFIKTKTLDVLNNNKWLITGLCLFISHINVYAAAKLFMLREILYLMSLTIVCLIFYFERASLKLILAKSALPLKFIIYISESFIKKTNLMMSKVKRGLLNLLLIYIPKPLKKLFLYIKKMIPSLPKPFVFIYKKSQKVYIAINPYFKLLIIVSLVFVIIAYFSIKTPDRYLPPEKIKGAVTILQNPLHFEQNTENRNATGFSVLFFYLKKTIFPHHLLFYYVIT